MFVSQWDKTKRLGENTIDRYQLRSFFCTLWSLEISLIYVKSGRLGKSLKLQNYIEMVRPGNGRLNICLLPTSLNILHFHITDAN